MTLDHQSLPTHYIKHRPILDPLEQHGAKCRLNTPDQQPPQLIPVAGLLHFVLDPHAMLDLMPMLELLPMPCPMYRITGNSSSPWGLPTPRERDICHSQEQWVRQSSEEWMLPSPSQDTTASHLALELTQRPKHSLQQSCNTVLKRSR